MIDISALKFDANGLIPAIVVDSISKRVLTLAYMNEESLKISMEKGLTCFWSRSRQELWLKGETSGNYQHIVSITADCDGEHWSWWSSPTARPATREPSPALNSPYGRATNAMNLPCRAS